MRIANARGVNMTSSVITVSSKIYADSCPFCGFKDCSVTGVPWSDKIMVVICYHCNSVGPEAYSEEEAVELWNRRMP